MEERGERRNLVLAECRPCLGTCRWGPLHRHSCRPCGVGVLTPISQMATLRLGDVVCRELSRGLAPGSGAPALHVPGSGAQGRILGGGVPRERAVGPRPARVGPISEAGPPGAVE